MARSAVRASDLISSGQRGRRDQEVNFCEALTGLGDNWVDPVPLRRERRCSLYPLAASSTSFALSCLMKATTSFEYFVRTPSWLPSNTAAES